MPVQQGLDNTSGVPQVSARQKLELSQLTHGALQREMMGEDVDIQKLALYLSSQIIGEVSPTITGATISRSIQGSSQLVLTFNDINRALLTSGFLNKKLDVQIDGLWFRLFGVDKSGDEVTVTFEDREISLLRDHSKWKIANRNQYTRAQFILSMIREVKEVTIPVQIPELYIVQPVEKYPGDLKGQAAIQNKQKGIPTDTNQQVKKAAESNPVIQIGGGPFTGGKPGSTLALVDKLFREKLLMVGNQGGEIPASKEQLTNANIILNVGDYMGVSRKIKVLAIMTALDESELKNLDAAHSDGESIGIFQQTHYWGTPEERADVATSAKAFYNAAIIKAKEFPDATYGYLCVQIQNPKSKDSFPYQQHQAQAEKYVTAFGSPGGDNEVGAATANGSALNGGSGGGNYYFRGDIQHRKNQTYRKPENSWSCIQRLAGEVDWVAFFVSGVFWYISEDALFKQQPLMYLFEGQDGITGIDGSYQRGAKSGTLTVTAHAGRWIVPPGSLVVVENMGPWNGRWLVSQYDRDLFSTEATITLIKPRPELPEPVTSNFSDVKNFIAKPSSPNVVGTGTAGINGGQRINFNTGPGDSAIQAQELLKSWALGKWYNAGGLSDDNPRSGLQQIRDTANHINVTNANGQPIAIDWKPIAIINWLISQGFKIGTSAWCADHHFDGLSGHAGGHAVDISSINGQSLASNTGDQLNLATRVATLLWNLETMRPRQLITSGVGGRAHPYPQLEQLCIPSRQFYYGNGVDSALPGGTDDLPGHRDHIHVGY